MRRVVVLLLFAACRFGFDATRMNGDGGGGDDGASMVDAAVVVPLIVRAPDTCFDGVKNAGETGTDCGGLCERCDRCATSTVPGSSCYCGIEWLSPAPTPGQFSAAFAPSANTAILAGEGGQVLWWDGQTFTKGFVGNARIEVAGGTGPDDIWLAGTEIWHWDGTQWKEHVAPGNVFFSALHARAIDDVWGVSTNGAVYHYDGTAWTIAQPFSTGALLVGAFGLSSSDVLLAGYDGSLNHWNGTALTPVPTTFSYIQAMAGVSATEVYFGGSQAAGTSVFRWNGTTFTDLNANVTALESIAVDGPGSVWALGSGEIAHYTGSAWTPLPMPAGYLYSQSISTAGRTELAAAGGHAFVADDGKRLVYDGAWHAPGITSEDITGIWGDATHLEAMTTSGLLQVSTTGLTRDVPPGATWSRILGFSASDIWAVSAAGNAYHFDGTAWTNRGTASGFITGWSTDDFWVISNSTTAAARHWTGSSFADVAMPTDFQAMDAWASDANNAWAAGRRVSTNAPALVKWNGTSWALVSAPPASQYLNSVWASGPSDVWTVLPSAATANVWHFDGSAWSDVTAGGPLSYGSSVRGGLAGIYVWAQGRVVKRTGTSWTNIAAGTNSCPSSPTATMWVSDTDVWIGASYGAVGRYRP